MAGQILKNMLQSSLLPIDCCCFDSASFGINDSSDHEFTVQEVDSDREEVDDDDNDASTGDESVRIERDDCLCVYLSL